MMHVRSLTHPVPIKSELCLYSEVTDQQDCGNVHPVYVWLNRSGVLTFTATKSRRVLLEDMSAPKNNVINHSSDNGMISKSAADLLMSPR